MRIAYIGNFDKMWDEEYIARAFESIGHEVGRIREYRSNIVNDLIEFKPDIVLWAKFRVNYPEQILNWCKKNNVKTVCWVWDLYWGYQRENFIFNKPMFKSDLIFTTDGGHDKEWTESGFKHKCIRQGIYEAECYREKGKIEYDVIFVGTFNPYNQERNEIIEKVKQDFKFEWFGYKDADQIRGPKLNRLYGKTKVIIGDSVYSPYYWSNRVVETLGRGGFLIHQEVEGLKEEFPYLVTYKRGDYADLKKKIKYYLTHNKEREEIINKNIEWVRNNHLCKHKVLELCQNL